MPGKVSEEGMTDFLKEELVMVGEDATLDPEENLEREKRYWLSKENSTRIWRNSDCVVLGRFLKPRNEVHLEKALALSVPVLKRTSGGGAVFHDPGNINYSLYLDNSFTAGLRFEDRLRLLSFPVIELLEKLGLPWSWVPPNNVYVDGRKISGSAQASRGGRLLHHGTLLVDCDLEKMRSLLKPGGKSNYAPVVNLNELNSGVATVENVISMFNDSFS